MRFLSCLISLIVLPTLPLPSPSSTVFLKSLLCIYYSWALWTINSSSTFTKYLRLEVCYGTFPVQTLCTREASFESWRPPKEYNAPGINFLADAECNPTPRILNKQITSRRTHVLYFMTSATFQRTVSHRLIKKCSIDTLISPCP